MNGGRLGASRPALATVGAAALLSFASPALAASCEQLAGLRLPDVVIQTAEAVPAGAFTGADKVPRPNLPAFCRVVARVRPAPDSDIGVEVWLPRDGWTGVFHGAGSGGYGGVLAMGYGAMAEGLKRGYVSATTDTGTAPATPLDGDALIGHRASGRTGAGCRPT
jgi:hypothetical protein